MNIDWISISPQSGNAGSNPVSFQLVSENETFEDKRLTVRAVCGDTWKDVKLILKGKKLPVGTVFNFDYTGTVQEVTLPAGKYKLQCWGAQGGDVTGTYSIVGSRGGYSEGVLTLTETTTLYIFVGGKGTDYTSSNSQTSTTALNGGWNGGGAGVRTSIYSSGDTDGRSFPRPGGGATDISTVSSSMSYSNGRTNRNSASLLGRIIVAGGGAGASARVTKTTTTSSGTTTVGTYKSNNYYLSGGLGVYIYLTANINVTAGETYHITNISCPVSYSKVVINWRDSSGTTLSSTTGTSGIAPSGAVYMQLRVDTTSAVDEGVSATSLSFTLKKDSTTTSTSTTSGLSNALQQGGGTTGKGQYPGTQTSATSGGSFGSGANVGSANYRYCGGGGGGGWYGGGTSKSDSSTSYVNYSGGGSGFVNTSNNASSRPSGYTGLQLDSGTTIDGNTMFESVAGGTEKGHGGNGYARITVLDSSGNGGSSGGGTSASVSWVIQSGTWNSTSNSQSVEGVAYTCLSPGSNGSTIIRCTFSGVTSITFNCVYSGESNYDYLTIGSLDTPCTRTSYGTSLKGNSGAARDITFSCDNGTHYVEFCYSKDSSVDTQPDNATVFIKSYS